MSIRETVRWGKDAADQPVIEVVRVDQLDVGKAKRLLRVIDRNLSVGVAALTALRNKRRELAELLDGLSTPPPGS